MTLTEAKQVSYLPYDMVSNPWKIQSLVEEDVPYLLYQTTYAGSPAVGYVEFQQNRLYLQYYELCPESRRPGDMLRLYDKVREKLTQQHGPPVSGDGEPLIEPERIAMAEIWDLPDNTRILLALYAWYDSPHLKVSFVDCSMKKTN